MSVNRYHGTLNGVQFRILQGDGYRRFFSRQTVDEQITTGNPARTSRPDQQRFYQTSWGGGSAWWRPLITPDTADAYQYSVGLDSWSQPGAIFPLNKTTSNTAIDRGMLSSGGTPYVSQMVAGRFSAQLNTVVGISNDVDGSFHHYLRYWNGTTWVNSTQTLGMGASQPMAFGYSPKDERYYAVSSSPQIGFVDQDDSTSGTISLGSAAPGYGTTIAPGPTGDMFVYDANALYRVNDAGTALVVVTDDGFGYDHIAQTLDVGAGSIIYRYRLNLMTSSSEGIYYIKNVATGGQPQPWIFRVERDAAGNIISVPIATLPVGTLALSIGHAFGQPMVVATYEWERALTNDGTHFTTEVWAPVGGTLGLLGKIYARDPDDHSNSVPTETVFHFLGTHGNLVLFGSTNGVWGYDAIRGGFHKLWKYTPSPGTAEYSFLQWPGESKLLTSSVEVVNSRGVFDVGTSTLGTDDDSMTLYSNWFDFGLPGEDKTITKLKTYTDETGNATTNQWRVYIISDDGTETDISHAHVNVQEKETTGLSLTGERFRYRLIYETTSATAKPAILTGIFVTAETGEIIEGWQLQIDGTQFVNVEGAPQHPLAVFDAWVALAQNSAILSFTDTYEALDASEATTYSVKIQSVSINKENPNESMIEVVLVRAD